MDGFDNSELPAPDLSDSFPNFHPDGLVLGGLDKPTLNAMADINSWADGTHPLGSLDVTGPAPASVQAPDSPPLVSAKSVEKTKIAEVFKTTGKKMLFLFDYGDEWRFEVRLTALGEKMPKTRYPRMVTSMGEAPPQYPDEDEE